MKSKKTKNTSVIDIIADVTKNTLNGIKSAPGKINFSLGCFLAIFITISMTTPIAYYILLGITAFFNFILRLYNNVVISFPSSEYDINFTLKLIYLLIAEMVFCSIFTSIYDLVCKKIKK